MAVVYDQSCYYIDFSSNLALTSDEKTFLENIQLTYKPVERAEFLKPYKLDGKITTDQYETMTGLPYEFE